METDTTKIIDETHLEVPVTVDDELVYEVEVVTVGDGVPAASEEIPQLAANAPEEEATSTSCVATSTPWDCHTQLDLLAREVIALKERLADLMKRVQERIIQEELPALATAANEPAALEIVNTPPLATRNSQPSSSNSAVKWKSPKSKYAKKRRNMIPGGITRVSRSFNHKPTTTTVGNVDLATAAYDDDDEFD